MRVENIKNHKGGWYVGDFDPSVFRTKDFEVGYLLHPKGQDWPKHYHKEAVEINLLVRGAMILNGVRFEAGTVFVIEKGEVAKPTFLEDCEIVCIKTPSLPGDKYIVED